MDYSLTVRGTIQELAPYLALLNSSAAPFAGTAINPNIATTSGAVHVDDDNGPANTNAPAADAAGIPWDERIHSKTKAMNADGTWRKRRGVTDAMIGQVETELKARGAQGAGMYMPPPVQQFQPPAASPPPAQQQFTLPPNFQPPPVQQFQPPAQQYQPQQPTSPPQQVQLLDFMGFMTHLANQMSKRDANGVPLMDVNYLAGICQKISAQFGVQFNAITDLQNRPDLIPFAIQLITNDGRWQ